MIAPLESARQVLDAVFGFGAFRSGQEEVLRAVLGGTDVLAVMPIGIELSARLPSWSARRSAAISGAPIGPRDRVTVTS